MGRVNAVVSFFLICLSLLVLTTSYQLGIGSVQSPEPGFMGFLAGALLFSLSIVIFIKDILRIRSAGAKEKDPSIVWGNLTKILILMVTLWCYTFALELLGYLISTFLLMFAMLYLFSPSPKKWGRQLFFAFVVANAAYLVFHKWLQVVLPAGIFRIRW